MARTRKIATRKRAKVSVNNEALLNKIAAIKQLLVELGKHDVAVRYKIAVGCRDILAGDGKVYGTNAARKLGKALGWSKASVYGYAAVAKTWRQADFDKLAAKLDKFDKPLSWSHYLALASVADAKRRRELIAQILREGWSVRELKQELDKAPHEGGKAAMIEEPPKIPRPLAAAVANYSTSLNVVKANAGTYGEEIAKQLATVDPSSGQQALLGKLKKARAALEELYQSQAKRLDAWIEKIETGEGAVSDVAAVDDDDLIAHAVLTDDDLINEALAIV